MKKIINGKVYDTEKATEVGCYQNTGDHRDFHWLRETLYRKRTGEYFIHGEGGPATKYAEQIERNAWASGERIIPMEYAEAKQWAEENMDADGYEKEFGVVDDETTETICISIPASAAAKLRRSAQEKGISLSALIASFANLEVQ